jgi:hypothetical protein
MRPIEDRKWVSAESDNSQVRDKSGYMLSHDSMNTQSNPHRTTSPTHLLSLSYLDSDTVI